MKTIETLSKDIYHVLDATQEHTASPELAAGYAMRIGGEFAKASLKRDKPRVKGKLWASDIGKKCLRQHYYNFNEPTEAEKLNGHTKFKFLYGNILEEAVLYFAEEAGHSVALPQHRVETEHMGWTISGRIDGVIDNTLIDVKSTSSFGYNKYKKEGLHAGNDSFGYREQLGFYDAFGNYPTKIKGVGFVWIDKQNGHILYTPTDVFTGSQIHTKIENIIGAVDGTEVQAPKAYTDKPYGQSGNRCLAVGCAYCPFKQRCWRDANGGKGLRTFLYSQGPVYLTEVKREPNKNVLEVT